MKLTLDPEQDQLKAGVLRFVADRYDDRRRRGIAASREAFSRDVWREAAELGWLGAGLSEAQGGFGGGPVETMVVMEGVGRGLMQEPFLPVLHALSLLVASGQDAEAVSAIVAGEAVVTAALEEAGSNGRHGETQIRRAGEGFRLSGRKRLVPHGDTADGFIVSCSLGGEAALARVQVSMGGIEAVGYRTIDGRRAADVSFEDVDLAEDALIATGEAAAAALGAAKARAIAALCGEAVGIAQFLNDTTLDYAKTRQQFGRPIGSFQAVQHRLADMFVAVEEARSLAIMAAVRLAAATPAERDHAMAAAKLGVMARALHVAREAIQLHGGVGMTEDLPIGAGFRRLKALSLAHGDENAQLDLMTPGIAAGIYA